MTLFFYGPNTYALRKQLDEMIRAYVAKAGSDFGLERIDGATISRQALVSNLLSAPFMASSRLLIIERLAQNKSVSDLGQLMKSVPKTSVVVFVEPEIDQRTKAFRSLMQADKVVKFEPLGAQKLLGWVRGEAQRQGGSMKPNVAQLLVGLAGEDQWRLANEVNKLVNYEAVVSEESVRLMVTPSVDRSVFDLVENMTGGHIEAALSIYRELLQQREPEIRILVMLQWQLRNLLLAKTAPGLAPNELATAVGMSPYVAGKAMAAQHKLSEKALVVAYIASADCEYAIKTGAMKAERAVEKLIYDVAQQVSRSLA